MSEESSPYPLRSRSRSLTSRRVRGSTSQVRSRSQVSSGTSIPAPVLSSISTTTSNMTKFDAMFPAVGTPCSDEDIAKEMATLAKGNRGTGKDLAKNLSLATASLEFKFGVTNGLTIRNSSGEIEDARNPRVMPILAVVLVLLPLENTLLRWRLLPRTLPRQIWLSFSRTCFREKSRVSIRHWCI